MKRIGITLRLLLLLLGSSGQLHSQDLLASFDSAVVETGQAIRLTLSVPQGISKPENIDLSAWSAAFPTENILGYSPWHTLGDYWQAEVKLIAFDADTLQLDPVSIGLQDGQVLRSKPLQLIVVATPSPDEISDMADVKDIHKEPSRWTDYLFWISLVVALLLFAAIWYLLASRGEKSRAAASRTIQLPPDELALRKLQLLASKNMIQTEGFAEYYGELSYILREYLQGRYHFPALESVASDIMIKLPALAYPPDLLLAVEEFLRRSDLAKFAQAIPPDEYHPYAMQLIRECIERTKPS